VLLCVKRQEIQTATQVETPTLQDEEFMITINGIRNGALCALAFGIVACASTPMPVEKLAVAKSSIERAEQAQAAQFAQVELASARNKYAAAQAATDKHNAEVAARMADQADVDAQLAESTARAKQQEQLVTEMDKGLNDLRKETLRTKPDGTATPTQQ
jgi:septal ring factor EnvC (AmiA/AmiB activator)